METISTTNSNTESVNVLLVGNNPIDMSRVLDNLQQIKGKRILTEIAFDLKTVLERLLHFTPTFIIIDDNLDQRELKSAIELFSKNKKTKDIPITMLKNSNYLQGPGAPTVTDYVLKQNLTAETLYTVLKNALKLRRTQAYLYEAYQKRKIAWMEFMQ
mgnify:CR=1 FL=1